MQHTRIPEQLPVMEKLKILSDAAKYDVACTSSGTSRGIMEKGSGTALTRGSATASRRMDGAFPF